MRKQFNANTQGMYLASESLCVYFHPLHKNTPTVMHNEEKENTALEMPPKRTHKLNQWTFQQSGIWVFSVCGYQWSKTGWEGGGLKGRGGGVRAESSHTPVDKWGGGG